MVAQLKMVAKAKEFKMRTNLIQNEHLTRQLDIIDVERLDQKVVIIGCGAIGSFVTLSLAKMGMTNLEVFDHDKVDTVNMNNQFFRFKDIGKYKADALQELVEDFTNVKIAKHTCLFSEEFKESLRGAIVISAVDSMAARKMILEVASRVEGVVSIIDPRMAAETYAQYAYPPTQFDNYAKTLYSDDDAIQERCTAKSTIYTVNGATSLVCKTVKNLIMEEAYPKNTQWDVKASQNPMMMISSNYTPPALVEETEEAEEDESSLFVEDFLSALQRVDSKDQETELYQNGLMPLIVKAEQILAERGA